MSPSPTDVDRLPSKVAGSTRRLPLHAGLALLLACGCNGDDGAASDAADTSTVASSTAGATTAGTTAGTGATPDTTGGPGMDVDSGPGTTAGPGPTSGATGTGNEEDTADTNVEDPKLCAVEVLDATIVPDAVIDMGDAEGQIPIVIGEALLRNCGCHYTDEVPRGYTDYISNAVPLSTHADFHIPFDGVFPMGFDTRLTWEATEVRVVFNQPLPMPPNECDVPGEAANMSMEDFVLFAQWFEAEAPDGANFP